MIELAILAFSIFFLSKFSCIAVENAQALSEKFKVSTTLIGMLIIGVIVSLPELSIAMTSSALGEGEIAAGNIFGTNVALVLFSLGLASFLYGIRIERKNLEEIGFVLLITIMVFMYLIFRTQVIEMSIGFLDGFFFFMIFWWYAIKSVLDKISEKTRNQKMPLLEDRLKKKEAQREGWELTALVFLATIFAIYASAKIAVDATVKITEELNIAKSFIGATLIALGTCLPETMIAFVAIKKKMYSIALGDIVGSMITNITLVLGATAAVSPLWLNMKILGIALVFAVVSNIIFFYFAAMRKSLGKQEGIIMTAIYFVYLALISIFQFGAY